MIKQYGLEWVKNFQHHSCYSTSGTYIQHNPASKHLTGSLLGNPPSTPGRREVLSALCRSDTEAYKVKAQQACAVYCTQIASRECKKGTERQSERVCYNVEWFNRHIFSYSNLCWALEIAPLSTAARALAEQLHTLFAPKSDETHLSRWSQIGHPHHRQG